MKEQTKHEEDLKLIRKIMESSSRFLSLSGLSGVFAGLVAIIGAGLAWFFVLDHTSSFEFDAIVGLSDKTGINTWFILIVIASLVLMVAVTESFIFSYKKCLKGGTRLWTPVTRLILVNMSIPLIAGAILIIPLFIYGATGFIVPVMLVFYGLALIGAGKYTFGEIHYLGVLQLVTGLVSAFFLSYGLLFWVAGFGLLHILYGLIMYRKYE